MRHNTVETLTSYVESLRPIIYINHFDFSVIDAAIAEIGQNAKIIEFNNAFGIVNFRSKAPMLACDLEHFLTTNADAGFDNHVFLLLKDVHNDLTNPRVIALLKWIAEKNLHEESYHLTVFIISSSMVIPPELENYITIFDLPLPSDDEIVETIYHFVDDLQVPFHPPTDKEDIVQSLALSLKGLSEFQINQILTLAYYKGGSLSRNDKQLILKEKEQFIKKSGMLEIVNLRGTIDDIGGLENLKSWLNKKAYVFKHLEEAVRFGVDIPKGIMIIGMPGCGKSMTAKATASLFDLPLVRLDVGRLLGKYVGESEENMRKALRVSEAISPCVLWIDEIEKAFSGIGTGNSGNEVTTRLFGQFLTWMQEKSNTVFVVATANDITHLPPEFLRKGRFDELFFVDLPNENERRMIFDIHLKKRKKWNKHIDTAVLMQKTEGYSGADIEAIVKESVERAFIEGHEILTTDEIADIIKDTKSISDTLKDKIDTIKKITSKYDFKAASSVEKDRTDRKDDEHPTNIPKSESAEDRLQRTYLFMKHFALDENNEKIQKGE